MSSELEIHVYPDLESLSRTAAERLIDRAQEAVAGHGRFSLSLAGGTTPRTLYQLLAGEYRDQIPWSRVHLFWGDERCVPPDHPDSNFAMVDEALISKVPLPPENVHRIPTEKPVETVAEAYEQTLREFFQPAPATSFPAFDLILLGMGEDGHTASLFPDGSALEERERWVAPALAPPTYSSRQRITLTLPVLNRANDVFFLVSGASKKTVVRAILNDPEQASRLYPAARVRPRGRVVWFLDEAARGAGA